LYNVGDYTQKEGASLNCLKCRKEIGEKAVFCPECLEDMANHPVKPDTKIFLPRTTSAPIVKKSAPRRKAPSSEERISRMKTAIQLLSIILAVSLMALVLSVVLLVESLATEAHEDAIGQNYGTITQKD
jgi:hypothetical protein